MNIFKKWQQYRFTEDRILQQLASLCKVNPSDTAFVLRLMNSGAGKGGKGGAVAPPPNVEKDGPRNSSKFDEKIGEGKGIHLRCEKIINIKYF